MAIVKNNERSEQSGLRLALLLPAGVALLAGLNAGLLLAGAPAPWQEPRLEDRHGMLMVLGFLGTLIALERAVALRRTGGFAAPALLGAGGLALITPLPALVGQLLLVAGLLALLWVYAGLYRRSRDDLVVVQALAAFLALVAAAMWTRVELPPLVPWLIGFLVLTIAAERVELARIAMPASAAATLTAHACAVTVALTLDLLWVPWGRVLFGASLLALVTWLLWHDVARRTILARGLPRYSAVALLLGYCWLALSALVWMGAALVADLAAPRAVPEVAYEIAVHAAFIGFAMSMVVAHAPVILPAVLRRPLHYRPLLWLPLVALHLTLAARLALAALDGLTGPWPWAALATALALLLFALVAAGSVIAGDRRGARPAPRSGRRPAPAHITETENAQKTPGEDPS